MLKLLGAALVGTGIAPLVTLGQRFKGETTSLQMWNRALTAEEVKEVADGGYIPGAFTACVWLDSKTGDITSVRIEPIKRKKNGPWFHSSFTYPR